MELALKEIEKISKSNQTKMIKAFETEKQNTITYILKDLKYK